MKLSGWGRYPVVEAQVHAPRTREAVQELVRSAGATGAGVIARGNGRAYGDSAISRSATLNMHHFNRMVAFDQETGLLVAEAGVLLADVITAFLPRGWFPMVTPGTRFVTIGGMIAADVHGKNHHKDGSFRQCVEWIDVMGADGELRRCCRAEHVDLFDQTLGGMGLTGVILTAAIRLRPVESSWIAQTTIAAPDLKSAMAAFENNQSATYSVAWIDCLGSGRSLGRSLVMLGEHARQADLPEDKRHHPYVTPLKRNRSVPIDFPSFALNGLTVRIFNALYYWAGRLKAPTRLVDWDSYFYPLDAVLGWNRIYGRKGFMQFQCVLPLDRAETGLTTLLKAISKAGAGSFLAVLKRMGPGQGSVSFPMEGYTLALDFPVNRRTVELMNRLDQITLDHGGRFYLAKDSRMTAQTLRQSDPRFSQFSAMRHANGMAAGFQSVQSERLEI